MEIKNVSNTSAVKPVDEQKNAAGQVAKGAQSESISGNSAFSVDISDAVKQMINALPGEDDVRRDKVAAIREQLAAGSYNLSGKDVASKILNALKN